MFFHYCYCVMRVVDRIMGCSGYVVWLVSSMGFRLWRCRILFLLSAACLGVEIVYI